MVPFIVVWSRNTIYVYPDTSGKKKRWRFGTGFGRGKWTSQLGLYFTWSIMLLSTRVAVIPFAYRWRTWNLAATLFFCAHCRVVFSLCTSGPTDSHFISHSKLDMTGKWALPLGLLIEFIGRVAQLGLYIYFVDHPRVDGGGPIILLVLVRVAVVIYWVLITVWPVFFFRRSK